MISLPDTRPMSSPVLFVHSEFMELLKKQTTVSESKTCTQEVGATVVVNENLPEWVYCDDGKKRELYGVMAPSGHLDWTDTDKMSFLVGDEVP